MKDFYKSLKTKLGRVRIQGEYFAYEYRVQLEDGTLSNLRTKRLCKKDVSEAELGDIFYSVLKQVESESGLTWNDLWERYKKLNPRFNSRSKETIILENQNAEVLGKFFGSKSITEFELKDIADFVDLRMSDNNGLTDYQKGSPYQARREKVLFTRVIDWGAQRGLCKQIITTNLHVDLPKVEKNVFSYEQFQQFLVCLQDVGVLFVVGAYLLGARRRDMIQLSVNDLRPNGIFICQSKTGKKQIKQFNPDLTAWLEDALKRHNRIKAQCKAKGRPEPTALLCKENGEAYAANGTGVESMFRRAKELYPAMNNDAILEGLTFHSLKHTSITNFNESEHGVSKQDFSGHSTKEMTDHYNHSIDVVPSNTMIKPKEEVKIQTDSDLIRSAIEGATHLRLVK